MSQSNYLTVGQDVGELRIAENRGKILRLAAPQTFPLVCTIIGLAALAAYLAIILPHVNQKGVLDAVFSGGKLGLFCFSIGCAGLLFGMSQFGLSYVIDGNARTIAKRRRLGDSYRCPIPGIRSRSVNVSSTASMNRSAACGLSSPMYSASSMTE